jgi:2-C-methyl-D-erythritol 4-phosphate cytidylyltransferase/2-C-methyl-D-erythritol 2,4-cyclodiphosphate synthase
VEAHAPGILLNSARAAGRDCMHVAVIIAAGGRGTRFGGALPKQWLSLAGRTLLERSIAAFDRHAEVREVVVVVPADALAAPESPLALLATSATSIRFVAGGARRQDSVANGFAAISPQAEIVLVHDAARPLVSAEVISRTIAAAAESGAAIAAVPVHDTVKQAADRDGLPFIARTLPRETLHLAQTPQGFRRDVLAAAIAQGGAADVTDEAGWAERAGYPVRLVLGDPDNMKITTERDLARAEAVLGGTPASHAPQPPAMRIGIGYDLHRLVEGRPLLLGGVRIPFERGLLGHSDADAVCHAVTDAILGAANLGDIGRLFPDTDPRWKDADSLALLADARARVAAAGWALVNVDIVVIAQQPKIGPHAPAIRASLARALDTTPDAISIKGKTNEGMDAIGRGEAIAVHAVALLTGRGPAITETGRTR